MFSEIKKFLIKYIDEVNLENLRSRSQKVVDELCLNEYIDLTSVAKSDYIAVVKASKSNPVLDGFLKTIKPDNHQNSINKMLEDLDYLLAYALVLEKTTQYFFDNPESLPKLYRDISEKRQRQKTFFTIPFYLSFKYYSILWALRILIGAQQRKSGSLALISFVLFLNIFQVAVFDIVRGNVANGICGLKLGFAFPNTLDVNPKNSAVKLGFKNPIFWTDLYQSWDMAFGSSVYGFPMFIVKLLIPSVSDYSQEPDLYMHKRLIALYLFTSYAEFRHKDHRSKNMFNWQDTVFTKKWGKHNMFLAKNL